MPEGATARAAGRFRAGRMFRTRTRRIPIATGTLILTAAAVATLAAGQHSRRTPHARKPTPAAAAVTAVPFQTGETLQYRVLFSKYGVNAARIETSVIEQRDFFGHPAWHFRAGAHTMDTTRLLFPLDDQFDSYTSATNLVSLQFEMYLHEMGKQQTSLYRMTGDADPAPEDVTALRVAPGTRDPIGFLYALRAADWQRTPEVRGPVFDGRHLYQAIARIDTPQGTVTVPAGNFPAFRIAIRLFDQGKEVADTHVWLWISRDAAHTPVLAEADLPIGISRIELLAAPGGFGKPAAAQRSDP